MTSQQPLLRAIAFIAPITLATAISVAVGIGFLLVIPEGNLRFAGKGEPPHP